jgi:hypothetical protein
MRLLDSIYRTYTETNCSLRERELKGERPKETTWPRMVEINDYAFFVLLFGQLEKLINREYEQSVGALRETSCESCGRLLPFLHQVNTIFSEDRETIESISDYYELRCEIAHGNAEKGLMEQGDIRMVYENIVRISEFYP